VAQFIQQLTPQNAKRVDGAATLAAAAVSTAFDTVNLTGPLNFLISVGAVSAANSTTVTVTESATAAGTFVANNNGTFTIATANADTLVIAFAPAVTQRFVQLSYAAPTGGTPSTVLQSVIVVAQTKAATSNNINVAGQTNV